MVLVGDAYQLAPVKARGGMFEHLCDDLPWAQRLSEVWRMRDPAERDASLALRSARGNRLRKAVGWYRTHDRLHTGDPIAMAADATTAYINARAEGKDAAIICDTWEIADAINQRLHDHFTDPDAPSVRVARDQHVRVGRPHHQPPQRRHPDRRTRHAAPPRRAHRPGPQRQPLARGRRRHPTGPHRRRAAHRLTPASSSKATTCASTSPWAMPAPCTPPKA